ncbi:hypothetical protein G7K71_02915 [Desulfofundulus sp. TPOSR]|uniref:hypothetical protein n=1 Tax=Desulfofundulus sp. TPOSR TaxID=2714340 RepID=UPI00140E0EB3|nr:hypothetical protein [Desulfofundulus sp. TPOSR]NHM25978.1 hypothetical protein [Desulfofundulus sp. TPOSR]
MNNADFKSYKDLAENVIAELSSRIKNAYPELSVPVDALVNAARLAVVADLLLLLQGCRIPEIAESVEIFARQAEPLMRDIDRLHTLVFGGMEK